MTTQLDNPFELAARERKARAIADEIALGYRLLDRWDRLDKDAAELAASITDPDARRVIASCAGQKPPSERTWSRVVEILRARIDGEMRRRA